MVGGKKIKTDYGTFRFNLGPGEDNQYHEIVCAGMDSVTAGLENMICQRYVKNIEIMLNLRKRMPFYPQAWEVLKFNYY